MPAKKDANVRFSGPGPDQVFHDALAKGEFLIQQCVACKGHIFYPRVICPGCGAVDLVWITPSGRGTVYSTTVIRRKAEKGGDYNVAIVDLAEGPRLMSRIDGVSPTEVRIGMSVIAKISKAETGPLLVFVPESRVS